MSDLAGFNNLDDLRELAVCQHGAFTVTQALERGATLADVMRRVLAGDWVQRHRHVYHAATQPPGPRLECRAALLALGGAAALSGRSAAWVWRLPGFDGSGPPELIVPGDRRYSHVRGVGIRRVQALHFRPQDRGGWPVTSLEVTVRDLAADMHRRRLRELVQALILERRTTLNRLSDVMGRGLRGSAALRRVLREVDPALQSYWEALLFRRLRRAGLQPEAQIRLDAAGRRCYLDLGFRDIRLGIEVDGFLPHMRRFADDRRRPIPGRLGAPTDRCRAGSGAATGSTSSTEPWTPRIAAGRNCTGLSTTSYVAGSPAARIRTGRGSATPRR